MPTKILPKKIVVAVEGSKPSLDAADQAIALAKTSQSARVEAIFVIQLPKYIDNNTVEMLRKQLYERGEKSLDELRTRAKETGVELDSKILETDSSVANSICAYAEKQGADLIVLGTRTDASPMTRLMVGSTAMSVTNNATCSVLIVR